MYNEREETKYIFDGKMTLLLGDRVVTAQKDLWSTYLTVPFTACAWILTCIVIWLYYRRDCI